MQQGDIFRNYINLSAEERRSFDRWLRVNLIAGVIAVAGLVAMALAASNSLGPRAARAESPQDSASTDSTSTVPEQPSKHGVVMSAYDLMIRIAPDELVVEQVDEPF